MYKVPKIDFIKIAKYPLMVYGAILLVGLIIMMIFSVQMDINFKGGTRFTYTYEDKIDLKAAKSTVESSLGKTVEVTESSGLNNEMKKIVVTLVADEAVTVKAQAAILKGLTEKFPNNKIALYDSNSVNPVVAGSFFVKAIFAVALAGLLVIIYVGIRFRKMGGISAGVMALFSLVLDCLIAFFACVIFRLEIDTNFTAVVLTILGYSLNDTIVIYDRVRENNKLFPAMSLRDKVNNSINQSIGRSVMTSVATLLAILTVIVVSEFYGLTTLRSFAIPMAVGIVSGCISTIFLACPLWYVWQTRSASRKALKQA